MFNATLVRLAWTLLESFTILTWKMKVTIILLVAVLGSASPLCKRNISMQARDRQNAPKKSGPPRKDSESPQNSRLDLNVDTCFQIIRPQSPSGLLLPSLRTPMASNIYTIQYNTIQYRQNACDCSKSFRVVAGSILESCPASYTETHHPVFNRRLCIQSDCAFKAIAHVEDYKAKCNAQAQRYAAAAATDRAACITAR